MTGYFLEITNHGLAPPADWTDAGDTDHFVQFYETDDYLLNSLRDFIGSGLQDGDAGIVITSEAFRRGLEQRLQSDGLDVSALTTSGQYIALDSAEMLAAFMRDGSPEPECFSVLIGEIIERAAQGRRHVRIYGDMVATLWNEGHDAAAIALERLWNDLSRTHRFSLFCAYPASGFASTTLAGPVGDVCAVHSRVIPAESYSGLATADDRLRAIALLQQKAASLEAEIAERERTARERDQARLEAETQRARLHALFMQAPALIAVLCGPEHVYELVNPDYIRVMGNRDYLGHALRDVLPELEREGFVELLDRVYTSGEPYVDRELRVLLDREGSGMHEERFLDLVLQPTLNPAGAVDGIMLHAVDVTEQVRVRRRVEELAAEREAILSQLTEGLVIADPTGSIVFMNDAARGMYGSSVLNVPIEKYGEIVQFMRLDGQPYSMNESPLTRAARHGETVMDAMVRVRRSDGTEVILDRSASPVIGPSGAVLGAVMTVRDVTKQFEVARQKDDFLSAAAHDLKTPLTTIKGVAQLLRRRAARTNAVDIAQLTESLEQIDATATRMNRFVSELLDVTRTSMDCPLQLNLRFIDLVAVAREAVKDCQRVSDSHRVVFESHVPCLTGWWDEERLHRVVANLVSNAVKYSSADSEIAVILAVDREGQVTISVRDHGIGIPAADLPHIFERFYRATNVDPHISGTGIGLSGVKQIIERHGGTIEVESQEGQGTTFVIYLPVVKDLSEIDEGAAELE